LLELFNSLLGFHDLRVHQLSLTALSWITGSVKSTWLAIFVVFLWNEYWSTLLLDNCLVLILIWVLLLLIEVKKFIFH